MARDGYWFTNQEGERIWCASPERERCGGHGYMNCYCGGDFCCCGNQGEIECMGCPDCEQDDDDWSCPECYDDPGRCNCGAPEPAPSDQRSSPPSSPETPNP